MLCGSFSSTEIETYVVMYLSKKSNLLCTAGVVLNYFQQHGIGKFHTQEKCSFCCDSAHKLSSGLYRVLLMESCFGREFTSQIQGNIEMAGKYSLILNRIYFTNNRPGPAGSTIKKKVKFKDTTHYTMNFF